METKNKESEEIIENIEILDPEEKSLFKPENVEKAKHVFTYGMLTVIAISGLTLIGAKPTHIIRFLSHYC